MPLTLELIQSLALPVEADCLRPDKLRLVSPNEAGQISVLHGNRQRPLSELFRISGSAVDDETIVLRGDCSRIKRIGEAMVSGTIHLDGSAGRHLGNAMQGGEIIVSGNAGDWAGAEMSGGRITIHGDAGHHAGGAYPSSSKGMTGGEILIHGKAGDEVGARMRRGFIAVGGASGATAGLGMIAGTIFLFDQCGPRPGLEMKRGTIVLFQHQHLPPMATFPRATIDSALFLEPYLAHLKQQGFPIRHEASHSQFEFFRGDSLSLGLGELLCRVDHAATEQPGR